jgi:hypothetical protein
MIDYFVKRDARRGELQVQPMGWVVVALIVILGASIAFAVWKDRSGPELRVTPTPPPVASPTPAKEAASPTPRPTATSIVRVPTPMPGVPLERVGDDFLAAWVWLFSSEAPHNVEDVTLYFAPLPEGVDEFALRQGQRAWYGLSTAEAAVTYWASNNQLPQAVTEGGEWQVLVTRRSLVEGWAVVEARYVGGTCVFRAIDTSTGEVSHEDEEMPCMRYLAGLVYDRGDGRWKIASMRQYLE